jgi:polyhydroxyalkanoate synthesis regulator phasin
MSSLGNDSAEVVLHEWVKRARSSQRDGARLLAQFLREAKREQGNVQRNAQEALVSAAGLLRREVDQLQRGLTVVSQRLAAFERDQKKAPSPSRARKPKTAVRRTTVAKRRRSLKKAA